MATGPGHMASGRLGWLQCPATCHKGAGMATGSGQKATERLGSQQGRLYGHSARPHATRGAGMATGSGHKAKGGWDGN